MRYFYVPMTENRDACFYIEAPAEEAFTEDHEKIHNIAADFSIMHGHDHTRKFEGIEFWGYEVSAEGMPKLAAALRWAAVERIQTPDDF